MLSIIHFKLTIHMVLGLLTISSNIYHQRSLTELIMSLPTDFSVFQKTENFISIATLMLLPTTINITFFL